MKKIACLIVGCLFVISCTKKGGTVNTHGTKLVSVEYDRVHREKNRIEYYKYNDAGQLQEIEEPLYWI